MPTDLGESLRSMRRMSLDAKLVPAAQTTSKDKPIVVGLYGVQGSGKTTLINQLKGTLGEGHYKFFDGSETIATVVDGGLDAFRSDKPMQTHWRGKAIDRVRAEAIDSGAVAVVAGHLMLWNENEEAGETIYTGNDLETYTHILYLDFPAELIFQRCQDDPARRDRNVSVGNIYRWQEAEKATLMRLCRECGILFSLIPHDPRPLDKVTMLLRDFRHHNEEYNLSLAVEKLDEIVAFADQDHLETMLVMDADKTLAPEDTGERFWRLTSKRNTLKDLFSGPLKYSYTAFRQAALLYEEIPDEDFEQICRIVASGISMYQEMSDLIRRAVSEPHVGVVIVTCGPRRIWEKILEPYGLAATVKVIGGGRIADGFVVTAAVKGLLVTRLQEFHHLYVWAFGDSPLDLEMLKKADQATIVVGSEESRSKSMDEHLANAIDKDGLRARQVVPAVGAPRLSTFKLPVFGLSDEQFLSSVFCQRDRPKGSQFIHATDRSIAKFLMTPSRDAAVAGPALRNAHGRIGNYLAQEYLADLLGFEKFAIRHVQGHLDTGYRLAHEEKTTIVALIRGGEPMALGVSDAFPLAMFVHAKEPEELKSAHVQGQQNILLVDSVVNTGKSVLEFLERIKELMPQAPVRVVVIAGVVQSDFLARPELADHKNLNVVALRLSDNKFKGTRNVDTGNRLFNTTHME